MSYGAERWRCRCGANNMLSMPACFRCGAPRQAQHYAPPPEPGALWAPATHPPERAPQDGTVRTLWTVWRLCWWVVGLSLLVLVGTCGFGFLRLASHPYRILESRGNIVYVVAVQVPPGTSREQLEAWAQEIKAEYSAGRHGMVNFYDGPQTHDHFLAFYSDYDHPSLTLVKP